MTPEDIEAQVFREKFKGYDQDEVDAFLDRVSEDLRELAREREDMLERVRRVEADAADSIEAERLLKRTLITAQRTADETVAEAVAQANSTISEADQRAAQIVGQAEIRAGDVVADAERRAADLVSRAHAEVAARQAAAEEELDRIRRAVAELARFRTEYRDRVRAVVTEQLATLDRAADMPEVPPAMTRLAGISDAPASEPVAAPTDAGDATAAFDTMPARPPDATGASNLRRDLLMNEEQS